MIAWRFQFNCQPYTHLSLIWPFQPGWSWKQEWGWGGGSLLSELCTPMSTLWSICPCLPQRHSQLILQCRRSGKKQHILWPVLSLSHHRPHLHNNNNYCLKPLLIWGLASFLDIPLAHRAIIYVASLRNVCEYHISLNNSQWWLLFFSHVKGAIIFETGDYFKYCSMKVMP